VVKSDITALVSWASVIGGLPTVLKPEAIIDGRIRDIHRFWHRALEKANLKNKRFHDLRTSAVRYWRINGDLSETNCILITGHKSRSVFDKFYNVIEAKDVFTAIQKSKKVIESKSDKVLPINMKKS
jgi:hypothetical protein